MPFLTTSASPWGEKWQGQVYIRTDQTTLIASSFFDLPKLNCKWNESLEDGYPKYLELRAWRQQQ